MQISMAFTFRVTSRAATSAQRTHRSSRHNRIVIITLPNIVSTSLTPQITSTTKHSLILNYQLRHKKPTYNNSIGERGVQQQQQQGYKLEPDIHSTLWGNV